MQKTDVFLQPLVRVLQDLWHNGLMAYDVSTKSNFMMRATLLWIVSNFLAYNMLPGWSTHDKMACLYCMEDTKAFQFRHGRITSWFDYHRRFLPENSKIRKDKGRFMRGKTMINDEPPLMLAKRFRWKSSPWE
ncbi:hypothetical protein Syun_021171 [Stephania yunnanensis]|uniref:Uncharacterized protein n=1 Tax=Stephania yunnanensis TaxID=152371 RepID=A0AAP0IF56_9MAGN